MTTNNALSLAFIAALSVICSSVADAGRSGVRKAPVVIASSDEKLTQAQVATRDAIVARLAELREGRDDFFGQHTLTHATASFDLARSGATQMVDPVGNLDPGAVDTFHNFIDEFLCTLAQLAAGAAAAG